MIKAHPTFIYTKKRDQFSLASIPFRCSVPYRRSFAMAGLAALLCLQLSAVHAQHSHQRFPASTPATANPGQVDTVLLFQQGRSNVRDWPVLMPGGTSKPLTQPRYKSNLLSTRQSRLPGIQQAIANQQNVCYTISGRNFLYQDSLILYCGDPVLSADGNLLVSGEFADYAKLPLLRSGGFCMKTDLQGNVIWSKLYDSAVHSDYDFMNYFRLLELKDGSILLAGRTTNKISNNNDFVLTKLDNTGNIIWLKTYESKFWRGFNGSGDLFALRDLEQDPVTGEVYFVGYHWFSNSAVTKIDPSDGRVIWSNAYDSYNSDYAFGVVINPDHLLMFQLENGSYAGYLSAIAINKATGDTLFTRRMVRTGDPLAAQLYTTYEVVKQNNGHYLLSGPTTGYFEFPVFTGTKDLFHAGIVELDANLNFVKAYGFKNRVQSNSYNTKISLYPDGRGVFTMLDRISSYNAEAHVSIFQNDIIYHQRKRVHSNEGIPYEPKTLQLTDGGFLNVKLMGDSTKMGVDGSRIDYYRMHTSDTASLCTGLPDSATAIWYFNYAPFQSGLETIHKDVFKESRPKKHDTWDFHAAPGPACQVISNCDTLDLRANTSQVCLGSLITVSIHKNEACGSLVPLSYDTNWVKQVTWINDSTCTFEFRRPGKQYIRGSLMGCTLIHDSVLIEVLAAKNSVDLGKDTVICPGNRLTLNAGGGFASYQWQDGTTDSTLDVTMPGTYSVTVNNGCGNTYKDTVEVFAHPAIPINIGPDRFKCNNDTLILAAPVGFLNYSWSSNPSTVSFQGRQIIVNPTIATTYMITAEKTPGCFAYDTVLVTAGTSPGIHLGSDTSICRNDSVILDAGAGFLHYEWSTGERAQTITAGDVGLYRVKATAGNGCSSFDTMRLVKLFDLPKPDLGPDSVICQGQTRTLRSTGNFASYTWSTNASGNTITVTSPGPYWLAVKDVNGCRGSDTTRIPSIENPPRDFLANDTSICRYSTIVLQSNASFVHYRWNTGSVSPSIHAKEPGTYWLEATSANTCRGRDSIVVKINDCLEGLFVPTAFTPNNNGSNDVLTPLLFGDVQSFNFQVYNRWGQLVFETTKRGVGWNGEHRGKSQDTNLFVWKCTYQLTGGKVERKSGTVLVVK